MERKAFQVWLLAVDTLNEAQKAAIGRFWSGVLFGAASLAAVELDV